MVVQAIPSLRYTRMFLARLATNTTTNNNNNNNNNNSFDEPAHCVTSALWHYAACALRPNLLGRYAYPGGKLTRVTRSVPGLAYTDTGVKSPPNWRWCDSGGDSWTDNLTRGFTPDLVPWPRKEDQIMQICHEACLRRDWGPSAWSWIPAVISFEPRVSVHHTRQHATQNYNDRSRTQSGKFRCPVRAVETSQVLSAKRKAKLFGHYHFVIHLLIAETLFLKRSDRKSTAFLGNNNNNNNDFVHQLCFLCE